MVVVNERAKAKTLKSAEGIVEPYAWRWNGNAYQLAFDNKIHRTKTAIKKPEVWFANLSR
ncbi:MAG: hypothetical protein NZ805_06180 [Armatimonadetes bacterium]|nr:hypothetical protein [Armatimonadota bacterium]MDW8027672.1 hypothetical protein [Armatimonadota bacterium]